ncbi:MAG: hypothetical protein Q7J44_00915 [Pseudotabrizicola sp.]|uniref:hypothetical protein n=1 Tax=Pseudotabrizicola sp. TaxID=2939647 RepID=UPI00271C9B8F|nr:hypothetical protein [Pseudotabrizicola sp.]MDO9637084.1 hypothetical protein [Pseudotabrizicola sp.]
MVRSLIIRLRGVALFAFLAISLAIASLGHHAPTHQDARAEAFLLSGFAIADLCAPSGSGKVASAVRCLACTPPGPVLIPAVACVLRPADVRVVAAIFAPRARKTVAAVHDPARAPRAPPFDVILSV